MKVLYLEFGSISTVEVFSEFLRAFRTCQWGVFFLRFYVCVAVWLLFDWGMNHPSWSLVHVHICSAQFTGEFCIKQDRAGHSPMMVLWYYPQFIGIAVAIGKGHIMKVSIMGYCIFFCLSIDEGFHIWISLNVCPMQYTYTVSLNYTDPWIWLHLRIVYLSISWNC